MKKLSADGREYIGREQRRLLGYYAYREDQKPKPAKKLPPIYRGEKRNHVMRQVMGVLRDWRQSPFENEGATRAGLRSALCLQGYGWERSDQEASSLVAEGLHLLGAVRPTWEQGQRHYVEAPENCRWCGVILPEEQLAGKRHFSFCSEVCARSAIQHWSFEARMSSDKTYSAAKDALARTRSEVRCCTNAACRKKFQSPNPAAKFCCEACSNAHLSVLKHQRWCACCGTEFTSKMASKHFCSNSCSSKFSMLRNGRWKPKLMSPVVFDFHFIGAPKPYRSTTLNPEKLDWMLLERGLRITGEVRIAA